VLAGRSLSVAASFTLNKLPSATVCWLMLGNTGRVLTSVTTTTNELVTLMVPSLTTVVIVLVLGPCASVGVHVIKPLPLMLIPDGGLTSE
jgi:hypothetical protein